MSTCMVRMEMPECCDECPMEYDGFMCGAIHKRFYPKKDGCYLEPLINPKEQRLPDCPIVAFLPENHGRLIDAEAITETCKSYCNQSCYGDCFACDYPIIFQQIDETPTIVPAERSET